MAERKVERGQVQLGIFEIPGAQGFSFGRFSWPVAQVEGQYYWAPRPFKMIKDKHREIDAGVD